MFTLLANATILTMDDRRPRGRSLLLAGDRILGVFDEPEPDFVLPGDARTIDFDGRALLPAFTDAHIHMIEWGFALAELDLSTVRSEEEAAARVAERARSAQPGEPIGGTGWSHNLWPGGRLPRSTRQLDRAAPDNPVVLFSKCLHLAWLNAAALRGAGIDASTQPPPGGVIDRDAEGRPTGILKEKATELAYRVMPPPGPAERRAALERATAEAHRNGIAAIHSLEQMEDLAIYQRANAAGELGVRVYFYVPGARLDDLRAAGIQSQPMSGRFTIAGIKLFADGSLGGRTAWMLEPYENEPENLGVPLFEPAALEEVVLNAVEGRLACGIHAIGDAAVRMVVDAFEKGRAREAELLPGVPPLRHRIEHLQTAQPADMERCGRLGIAASMQPVHLLADWAPADEFLGERARYTYALRSAARAGIPLAFGSDAPVETVNVPLSLHTAVNRQDRDNWPEAGWRMDEALTVEETLRGHTRGGAEIAGDAARRGRLAAGCVGDLVVLDRDPTAIERAELRDLRVLATLIDGQCVHGGEFLEERTRPAMRRIVAG